MPRPLAAAEPQTRRPPAKAADKSPGASPREVRRGTARPAQTFTGCLMGWWSQGARSRLINNEFLWKPTPKGPIDPQWASQSVETRSAPKRKRPGNDWGSEEPETEKIGWTGDREMAAFK